MNLARDNDRAQSLTEEVAEVFVRRSCGEWTPEDQSQLEARIASDAAYAHEFEKLKQSWGAIGSHAESPELMRLRESAIAWIRRENVDRWRGTRRTSHGWLVAAGIAAVTLVTAVAVQFSPYGYHPGLYTTDIGQEHELQLSDGSRVELDAATRLQVKFTDGARTIRMFEGQAQFSVAKDPTRPFKVQVGDRTIVALGTVFTVEYVDERVHVAMVEGKVAVLQGRPSSQEEVEHALAQQNVAIAAGEEMLIAANGRATTRRNADIAAATAWRDGNVIFRDEPLSEAVRRLNRYSHVQLEIADGMLASIRISGVFKKGDSGAFARTVQAYYPVLVESDADTIRLRYN